MPAPPNGRDFAAARTSSRGASPRARSWTAALARLKADGVSRALLVAGDQTPPAGEYASTLQILESGALDAAGITSIGVAGHPEGNPNIPAEAIWDALARKQAYAEKTGARVHIVSQFGFDPAALAAWDAELTTRGIALPLHAGVAGPASLKSLARFAMMCGIGASLGALLSNPTALGSLRALVKTIDEIFPALVRLLDGPPGRRYRTAAFLRVWRRHENRGVAGGRARRPLRNR